MKIYQTYSSDETRIFGDKLVSGVMSHASGRKGAVVLALYGDLGSGKTTFAQGFLRGLGVRQRVNSPTFVIFKRFKIHDSRFKNIYHIDCYRIKKAKELVDLGIKEILAEPKNIVLIEWPERLRRILPKEVIKIYFKYGKKENERIIGLRDTNMYEYTDKK